MRITSNPDQPELSLDSNSPTSEPQRGDVLYSASLARFKNYLKLFVSPKYEMLSCFLQRLQLGLN